MHADAIGSVGTGETFEQILARASTRDRANLEKHAAFCDVEGAPGHGVLWRQLVCHLASLVGLPVQMVAQAATFFIADGRYRMQVFALEDKKDGLLTIYMPDVIDQVAMSPGHGCERPGDARTCSMASTFFRHRKE